MHSYLSAVGFSELKDKKELTKLLKETEENPSSVEEILLIDGSRKVECVKYFADRIGLMMRGEVDADGIFSQEYYFPYFKAIKESTKEDTNIERVNDKDAYQCVCDDVRTGVPLIFYLQNMIEYLSIKGTEEKLKSNSAFISALGKNATVLLPIEKDHKIEKTIANKNSVRSDLISAARNGDQEAMEILAIEDIDTYSVVLKRTKTEDILSIVETYIMPFGIQNDEYAILGEIVELYICTNSHTNEEIYVMTLNCNEISIDLCINKKELLGEPVVGRRIKATAWFQGVVQL
ncbi:MAG: hypothetical protein K0R15_1011 [Clostridiales bacterium]|jgi:hypothetical protein|nr:hypothetical protein [Clostridiales bacterium]